MTTTDRRWDDERNPADAPVWLNADEASAWASGWNAAVREATDQSNRALASEQVELILGGE